MEKRSIACDINSVFREREDLADDLLRYRFGIQLHKPIARAELHMGCRGEGEGHREGETRDARLAVAYTQATIT